MTNSNITTITQKVLELPEVYQPIFGHAEYTATASRECEDRLAQIIKVYRALSKSLDRPLRILDIGCAQGYFSLNLAKAGATVLGVDYLERNIELCRALADENPSFNIRFELARAETIIESLQEDEFDLVLGLSVFHHIIYEKGIPFTSKLLNQVAEKSKVSIFEFALKSEPLYWGNAQPEDPRSLLDGFPFTHELSKHHTHLCEIERPLYVASKKYWVLDGLAGKFDHWSDSPHALEQGAHGGTRRYFFAEDTLVKLFRVPNESHKSNFTELANESAILDKLPNSLRPPRIITFGQHETEAWLVRTLIPGILLLDIIKENIPIDATKVLRSILKQTEDLERLGYYHNDIRTWNILITPEDDALLIDYGAICDTPQDCTWPDNIYLSIFILLKEISSQDISPPTPIRPPNISPYNLPPPFNHWAAQLWQRPLEQWSFSLMAKALDAPASGKADIIESPPQLWEQKMESAIKLILNHEHESRATTKKEILSIEERLTQQQAHSFELLKDELSLQRAELRKVSDLAVTNANRLDNIRGDIKQDISGEFQSLRDILTNVASTSFNADALRSSLSELNELKKALTEKYAELDIRYNTLNELFELKKALTEKDAEAHSWRQRTYLAEKKSLDLVQSTSWKITAPVRHVSLALSNFPRNRTINRLIISPTKRAFRPVILGALYYSRRHPRLRNALGRLLRLVPALHKKVIRMEQTPLTPIQPPIIYPVKMSARARQIYLDLDNAINKEQKGRQQ
ncbi:methyltransferase domain-containing protein [Pseudomonas sp. YH-1]|uniref:methyltransferase domain-containing protein n=1 Tax=Pseudomonas sp. YH-1 TaxID=3384787 RepID=UPI003F7EF6B1